MGDTRLWEIPAYGRGTSMRDMPMRRTYMRWPMGNACLCDGLWEMHAYEMAYERCTSMRCTPVRGTPMGWPVGNARL